MVGLEALHPPRGPPGSGAPALSGLPDVSKPFTVLGIETSCDDTAAAVVRSDGEVLGEVRCGTVWRGSPRVAFSIWCNETKDHWWTQRIMS